MPDSTLIIGVATSTAERVQLARLLDGADALLLVASAEQAAAFLERAGSSARPQIVLPPGSIPGGVGGPAVEGAVADGPAVDGAATDRPAVEAAGRDRADGDGVEHGSAVGGAGGAPGRLASLAHSGLPAGLSLDVHRRVVRWKDKEVMLTRLEHDFLRCLATEPGRVWTYQRLHLTVWGNEHLGHGSHIHSVVKRLRRKLARLGTTVTIHAVRGVGFHLPTSR